jgi:hypothetical protein
LRNDGTPYGFARDQPPQHRLPDAEPAQSAFYDDADVHGSVDHRKIQQTDALVSLACYECSMASARSQLLQEQIAADRAPVPEAIVKIAGRKRPDERLDIRDHLPGARLDPRHLRVTPHL